MAPDYPMVVGAPQPAGSGAALAIHGLIVAFFQGKALPLLCFLFGYSLCAVGFKARATGLDVKNALRTRNQKLLVVGVLHGGLVYFGDILTTYALCGLLMGRYALSRPKKILKVWTWLTVALIFSGVAVSVIGAVMLFTREAQTTTDASNSVTTKLFLITDAKEFWSLNLRSYLYAQLGTLFVLPMFLWLTIAGMLACRFRLFSNRRFSRQFWAKHIGSSQFTMACAANLVFGITSVYLHSVGAVSYDKLSGIVALAVVPSVWLTACVVGLLMRRWHKQSFVPKWILWLSPAGRHTLIMYLLLSLVLLLSSSVFLGLNGSTLVRVCVVLGTWMLVTLVARVATERGWRDPVARWLSAVTLSTKQHA